MIPSESFMMELAYVNQKKIPDVAFTMWEHVKEVVQPHFPNYTWTYYIEFYNPRYRDFYYHFNNWTDLENIINKTREEIDYRQIRNRSMEFALEDRQVNLNAMKTFFQNELGFQI